MTPHTLGYKEIRIGTSVIDTDWDDDGGYYLDSLLRQAREEGRIEPHPNMLGAHDMQVVAGPGWHH